MLSGLSSHQDSLNLDPNIPAQKGLESNISIEKCLDQLFSEVRQISRQVLTMQKDINMLKNAQKEERSNLTSPKKKIGLSLEAEELLKSMPMAKT